MMTECKKKTHGYLIILPVLVKVENMLRLLLTVGFKIIIIIIIRSIN